MEDINLFGEIQKYYESEKPLGKIQQIKHNLGYHKAGIYESHRYCKYCDNFIRMEYHNKMYFKCRLIGDSNSEATDIRTKDTCNKFTQENRK